MKTKHILKTSNGITVTATFDEGTATYSCEWEPRPTPAQFAALEPEYRNWRDAIFESWSNRTGKGVLVITY